MPVEGNSAHRIDDDETSGGEAYFDDGVDTLRRWQHAALNSWVDGVTAAAHKAESERLQADNERLRTKLADTEQALAAARTRLDSARADKQRLKATVAERDRRLSQLQASASWRLTRPLRAATRFIRSLSGRKQRSVR